MVKRLQIHRDWNDYKDMAHKLAHKYYPVIRKKDRMYEYGDMIGIAGEAFNKTIRDEKDGKIESCKFSTALYQRIQHDLQDIIRGEETNKRKNPGKLEDIEDWKNVLSYDDSKFHFLSEEAKEVFQLLKNSPKELIELSKSLDLKQAITRYLKISKRWKPRKLNSFWSKTDFKE